MISAPISSKHSPAFHFGYRVSCLGTYRISLDLVSHRPQIHHHTSSNRAHHLHFISAYLQDPAGLRRSLLSRGSPQTLRSPRLHLPYQPSSTTPRCRRLRAQPCHPCRQRSKNLSRLISLAPDPATMSRLPMTGRSSVQQLRRSSRRQETCGRK